MNTSRGGTQKRSRKIAARLGIAGVALAATLGIAACGGSSSDKIDLVAYSTPQQAYEDGIEPAFTKTPDGDGVDFSNSFGSSGDQSRAVESGQPADVVAFSLEPDIDPSGRGRQGRRGLEQGPVPRHRHRLGGRARWSARATRRTSSPSTT